jgi:hypothetical protein
MRRRIVAFLCAAVFMAVAASPAWADAGSPGSTFPEQPGDNGQTACATVTTNPGSGAGGAAGDVISPVAGAITTGVITDACFGG